MTLATIKRCIFRYTPRQGLFALAVVGLVFSVQPGKASENSADAQVVSDDPLVLSGQQKELSEANLRFTARTAEMEWQRVKGDPAEAGFSRLFKTFMDVARIESVADSARLAQLKGASKIGDIAAAIVADLKKKGVSANAIGMAALATIANEQNDAVFDAGFDDLQVRYTLVLDYLEAPEAGQISLDLADRLTAAGRQYYATEILRNFLSGFIERQPDEAAKLALARRAARSAAAIRNPEVIVILTDVIERTPKVLRADMALAITSSLPEDFESLLNEGNVPSAAERDLRDAWRTSLALARGAKPARDVADIARSSATRLDSRAFDFLVSAAVSREERNRLISATSRTLNKQGRPLSAFQKLRNLDFSLSSDPEVVVETLSLLAEAGYAQYVDALATDLAAEFTAGQLVLSNDQILSVLSALETSGNSELIDAFANKMPGGAQIAVLTKWRHSLRLAFDGKVKAKLGAELVADLPKADANLPAELTTALYLTAGSLPPLDKITSTSSADVRGGSRALLVSAACQIWLYGDRQALLIDFLRSDAPVGLRAAVAEGITGNDAFDIRSLGGKAVADAIRPLLASPELGSSKVLIAASVGAATDLASISTSERQEVERRILRYRMGMGAAVPVGKDDDLDSLVTKAVFGDFHDAVSHLKLLPDFLQRTKAFRKVAESKALRLDRKLWLNSAEASEKHHEFSMNFRKSPDSASNGIELWGTDNTKLAAQRPFLPNLLLGGNTVSRMIPVDRLDSNRDALAGISKRGETRGTRLMRFSSEHFDDVINLGVREYLFLREKTSTPRIIFVTRGVMTIGELVSQIAATDPDAITEDNGIVTFNVPLAVNEGATLVVSGQEIKELRLSTDNGAFLVNSGRLYVEGAKISSHSAKTNGPTYIRDHKQGFYFRPFLLSWSGSETYAANSQFLALGYSGGRTYGVSLSSGSTDTASSNFKVNTPTGYFINNSFDNLYYGFYVFEADDIVFVGNELRDGVIYGLDPHDRSHNLMMAYNTAYGSLKKHGIIISREVDNSFIVGNLSFDNHGSGIMLDRQSYGTIVYANVASHNHGDGFSAMESPCALVDSNVFSGNARAGVKIRNSWDIHVEGNVIADNKASGVEAYIDDLQSSALSEFRNIEKDPYYPIATVSVSRNVLSRNRIGVSARGATEAMLNENRFVDQLPRYLGGDLKPLALEAVSSSSLSTVSMRSQCVPRVPVKKGCSLTANGIIPSHVGQSAYSDASADTNYCVDRKAPQAAAYHAGAGE